MVHRAEAFDIGHRNVNLLTDISRTLKLLLSRLQASDIAPDSIGGLAQFAVNGRGEAVAGKMMKVVDRVVNGCETLQVSY